MIVKIEGVLEQNLKGHYNLQQQDQGHNHFIGKYSGQKPLFISSPPPDSGPLISSVSGGGR